jgi:RNA polymerase subunit RPABC4/transcription elongation factor Spt4
MIRPYIHLQKRVMESSDLKICIPCDTDYDSNSNHCGKCGLILTSKITCKKCKNVLNVESKFCFNCGNRIGSWEQNLLFSSEYLSHLFVHPENSQLIKRLERNDFDIQSKIPLLVKFLIQEERIMDFTSIYFYETKEIINPFREYGLAKSWFNHDAFGWAVNASLNPPTLSWPSKHNLAVLLTNLRLIIFDISKFRVLSPRSIDNLIFDYHSDMQFPEVIPSINAQGVIDSAIFSIKGKSINASYFIELDEGERFINNFFNLHKIFLSENRVIKNDE